MYICKKCNNTGLRGRFPCGCIHGERILIAEQKNTEKLAKEPEFDILNSNATNKEKILPT